MLHTVVEARGGSVVEALLYKPEGRGIDSRWCHWNFSLTSFRPRYDTAVDSGIFDDDDDDDIYI
jgi:hypothetical protein